MLHLVLLHAFAQVLVIFNLLEQHHCHFIQLFFQIFIFILRLCQLVLYVHGFNLFLDSALLSWFPVLNQSFKFFILVFLFVFKRFRKLLGIILNRLFVNAGGFRASFAVHWVWVSVRDFLVVDLIRNFWRVIYDCLLVIMRLILVHFLMI